MNRNILIVIFMALVFSGCANKVPLIFTSGAVLGIETGGTQPTKAIIGFKYFDAVYLPAGIILDHNKKKKDERFIPIKGRSAEEEGDHSDDALSVFSSFSGNGTKGNSLSLGKTFATGIAAQKIAKGLEKRLENDDDAKRISAVANCIKALNANSSGNTFTEKSIKELCN